MIQRRHASQPLGSGEIAATIGFIGDAMVVYPQHTTSPYDIARLERALQQRPLTTRQLLTELWARLRHA